MPIKTRRWNDPTKPDDGFRLLITLLCSSAGVRESRCHRSILRELIESAMKE